MRDDALEHELRERSYAFVRDDEKKHQDRPDQKGEMQSIGRRRDQERKNLHESIRRRDAAEDQHDFPDGSFRPLPEILQALHYRGTRSGCHGVSLSQHYFKFFALLLNFCTSPFLGGLKIVFSLLQFRTRYFCLLLHRFYLLLPPATLFLFF